MTVLALVLSPALAGDNIHVHMAKHLELTQAARDAVIAGDLATAKAKLKALGDHAPVEKHVTPEMHRYISAMQFAAKAGAQAQTLEKAGVTVARVALQCGNCHSVAEHGPKFGPFDKPKPGDELSEHMQRHAWASSRLWEGLVEGNRARWDAGALGLLEDPWMTDDAHGSDPQAKVFADRVHEQGMDAILVWSDERRALLYGQLLGTCSGCHTGSKK